MKQTPYVIALSGALALVAARALSQPPQPAPDEAPGTFRESVEVNIVNLNVRVTDKDGRPVKGLVRDDFQIFEQGKPVPVANFYEVSSSTDYDQLRRDREAAARSQEPLAPAVDSARPSSVPPPIRHLAIFVDNAN